MAATPLSAEQWSWLESLTSIVTLALAIGAGIVVFIELTQAADSRNLQNYQDFFEKLMSEEQIDARKFIYQHLASFDNSEDLAATVLAGPAIHLELSQGSEKPDYYESAIELAKRCNVWRNTNLPNRQKDITFSNKRL